MAKLSDRNITLTTNLELTEKETQMLAYLASFGGKIIGEKICGGLGKEFKEAEWEQFWSTVRSECEQAHTVFKDTQSVFRGWKVAQRPRETAR